MELMGLVDLLHQRILHHPKLLINSHKHQSLQVLNQEDHKSRDRKKDNKKEKNLLIQDRRSKMVADLLSNRM
jgi:hypothetical protein